MRGHNSRTDHSVFGVAGSLLLLPPHLLRPSIASPISTSREHPVVARGAENADEPAIYSRHRLSILSHAWDLRTRVPTSSPKRVSLRQRASQCIDRVLSSGPRHRAAVSVFNRQTAHPLWHRAIGRRKAARDRSVFPHKVQSSSRQCRGMTSTTSSASSLLPSCFRCSSQAV